MGYKNKSKTTHKKRAISSLLVCAMLLSIIVGSFAYFTDRAETQATATAGTLAINLDDSNINFLDADNKDILNPGDKRTVKYKVTNVGNKSTDIRETLILSVFDKEGNALSLDGDATTQSQFDIYAKDNVELVAGYGYRPVLVEDSNGVAPGELDYVETYAQPIQVKTVADNVITYITEAYTLNGNDDIHDEAEIETDITVYDHTSDYVLVFRGSTGNAFQGAILKFDLLVEAKQHRNTEAVDWIELQTETYVLGNGNSLNVVAKVAGADASLVDHDDTSVYTYNTTNTLTISSEVVDTENVVGTAVITGFKSGEDEADMIAADYYEVDGELYRIVGIAASAFEGNAVIESADISGNVTEIGDAAFKDATNLTDVNLNEGTETLGNEAFTGTSITEVEVPASVTTDVGAAPVFDNGVTITIHVHSWDEGKITTPATCAAEGVKTYACTGCKKTRTEVVPVNGEHTYSGTSCTSCGLGMEDVSENWSYTVDDATNTITLTSYIGESNDVVVRSAYKVPNASGTITDNGYKVYGNVVIERTSFSSKKSTLTSIVFEDGVRLPTTMSTMFYNYKALTSITGLENLDTSNVTNMAMMFSGCTALTTLDLSDWNTSNVTDMQLMFNGCSNLTTLNVSNWDTSNVTNMGQIFSGCTALTTLDLSDWETSKVTNMYNMFNGCTALTSLDLSGWDTSNIDDMENMFYDCKALTAIAGIEDFDTSKVTDMGQTFSGCNALTTLDLSNWETSNVTTMKYMFYNCKALTTITGIENWDTSKVTDMGMMFRLCFDLTTLDLSNWDISNVTDMEDMFSGCTALTSITVKDEAAKTKVEGSSDFPSSTCTVTVAGA